jgi:hypothetical protein
MKHFFMLFLIATISTMSLKAQYGIELSAATKAYNKFLSYENKIGAINPKIQKLIAADKKKRAKNMEDDRGIPDAAFSKLTAAELLAYCSVYGETYNQVCDVMMPIVDAEKKILPYLFEPYNEFALSTRQETACKEKKAEIVKLVMAAANKEKRLGINFKSLIYNIKAYDAIPTIVTLYKASVKKDGDILTLLNLLMFDAKYEPFMTSTTQQKLYADAEKPEHERFITFNKENEALILQRALDFYASL